MRCSAPQCGHLINLPEALARVERVTGPQRSLYRRAEVLAVSRLGKKVISNEDYGLQGLGWSVPSRLAPVQ